MTINNSDYLAQDNATYDMDKINAMQTPVTGPSEETPGTRVAGPWTAAIKKGLKAITPEKFQQTQTVKGMRERFKRESDEVQADPLMDRESIETLEGMSGTEAPDGPFTSTNERPILVGRTDARNINLDFIKGPEDIKLLIDDMAEFQGGNAVARRGKITHEHTEQMAKDINAIEMMTGWKPGTAWNAEQITAARQLLVNTAATISKEAKRLTQDVQSTSDIDWANFAKMQKTFGAMNSVVSGATSEAGRALSAHKIPMEGADRTNAIKSILLESGGADLLRSKAKLIADAGEMSNEELAKLVNDTLGAPNQGVLAEVWINGLLSSPTTHLVNVASNAMVQLNETYLVKPTAAVIGALRKGEGGETISIEEVAAETYGMMNTFGEAIQLFARRLGEKESSDLFLSPSKTEMEHWNAFSSERLLPNTMHETSMARAVDLIGDWYVRLPGRFLESEDLFFKTMAYRKEINALAVRQAKGERLTGDDYIRRVNELINSPTQEMNGAASSRSDYETFTGDPAEFDSMFGNMSQAITYMTARHSSLKFIAPFVRTPANIVRYAVENSVISPVSKKWRDDYMAGGVKRDVALARWSLGTMAYVSILQLYENGNITGTGPTDNNSRKLMYGTGWQPNSVKVGDTYYSYNRLQPMGTAMTVIANGLDRTKYAKSDEEATVMMMETILSLGQSFQDNTFMASFAELFKAIEGGDSGLKSGARYVNNIGSTFVPAWLNTIAVSTDVDPSGNAVKRAPNKFSKSYEGVMANLQKQIDNRTPWAKHHLPAQRNWKGEVVTKSGGGYGDELFFVKKSEAKDDPSTKALLDNWVSPPVPGQVQSFVLPEAIGLQFGITEFPVDLLDMDANGGQVYEIFQEYVGKRRKELVGQFVNSSQYSELDKTMKGNNSVASTMLKTLLAKGQQIGKIEFFGDYNKLAKEHGWKKFDDEDILRLLELKYGEQGKEFPTPEGPQQTTIGF